jgi:hypothetical protein
VTVRDVPYLGEGPRPPTGAPSEPFPTNALALHEADKGECLYLQRWDRRHGLWRWVDGIPHPRRLDTVCKYAAAAGGAAGHYRWAWVRSWTNRAGTIWDAQIDLTKSTPPVWCGPEA